jgi:hypothetical protein
MRRFEKAHLTRDDLGRVIVACLVALMLSGGPVFFLLELPAAPPNGPTAPPIVKDALGRHSKTISPVCAECSRMGT